MIFLYFNNQNGRYSPNRALVSPSFLLQFFFYLEQFIRILTDIVFPIVPRRTLESFASNDCIRYICNIRHCIIYLFILTGLAVSVHIRSVGIF